MHCLDGSCSSVRKKVCLKLGMFNSPAELWRLCFEWLVPGAHGVPGVEVFAKLYHCTLNICKVDSEVQFGEQRCWTEARIQYSVPTGNPPT